MIGLVDGNNFYASCERVFQPALNGKPVAILGNGDGCVIARSNECKALGVKMGQPIHEVPTDVRRQLVVRSANFALYGDLSGRISGILKDLFSKVEVYSIDESFVSFDGIADREKAAHEARARILKWVGVPVCVGLGNTKTRAKAGNKLAKKTTHGVVEVANPWRQLDGYPVEDLWGVGRRWSSRLGSEGILTATDLMRADPETLRARYGVVLARTQQELLGQPCSDLVEIEPDRKQIVVSRSFGRDVLERDDVAQAVATFATRAAEKLRGRGLLCSGVWVWINTNPFKPGVRQYHPSRAFNLVGPTADSREILIVAQALVRALWKPGYAYKKAGVGLLDLTHGDIHQADLFAGIDPRSASLMAVLDAANAKFGRGTMSFASAAQKRDKPRWSPRQGSLSPAYTSKWSELLRVR